MSGAVILNATDFDKFIAEMKKTLREELSKVVKENHEKPKSRKEMARHLGISVFTFDKRFKRGEYPAKLMHGKGRCKTFYATEFDNFLKKL